MEWKDIKLKTAKKIFLIEKSGLTETEYIKQVSKILYPENRDSLPAIEVRKQIMELINQTPNPQLNYQFAGGKLGFQYDLSQLWWGQFVDGELSIESVNNIWENIENILAIVIRPINQPIQQKKTFSFNNRVKKLEQSLLQNKFELEEYDSVKRNETAKQLLELSIDELYGCILFFCEIASRFINITITSLQQNSMTQN